ncbi:MAG: outer membrane beta-barrel protein [Alphaproteobacteria bacterium]|nr:outer membrane beta-barrel protein [Alphaproteobacteria bacterium]
MKKVGIAMLAVASMFVAGSAHAAQGLFGGRTEQDGEISVRRSTTEQFNPIRGQSVAARQRPDFDPTPIDVASFQLFPAINVAGYYDSNIYATQAAKNDDVVTKINPSLTAASNWGRHALAFTGLADINTNVINNEENNVGGAAQIEGRFDIENQTWLAGSTSYQRATEPRGNSSSFGAAAEPTQFDTYGAGTELYRGVGQLKTKANYDFNYKDYDTLSLVGGATLNQSNRNRTDHKFRAEVGYDVTQNFKPFVRGAYDILDYTNNSLRNSTGYNVDAGAKFDFGGITTAEAFAGYKGRDYYNFASGGVNTFDFGADVLWNVTELTSIQAEANRSIEETTLGGAALAASSNAYVATGGSLTATHELRRDVILEGNASFTNNDYKNNVRNDDTLGLGLGTRYFINRNFYSDLTYDFVKRMSNIAVNDYDRHVALVRFGAQY